MWSVTSCTPKSSAVPTLIPLSTNTPIKTTPIKNTECQISGHIWVSTFDKVQTIQLATIRGSEIKLGRTIDIPDTPVSMISLSPTGTKFIYLHNNDIYLQNLETGHLSQINHEMVASIGGEIRWSPNEEKIVLSCSTPRYPKSSICLADLDSGNIETLVTLVEIGKSTPDSYLTLDDWSRDGSFIVFTNFTPSEKGQKQEFEIYTYNWHTQTTQQIFDGNTQNLITQIRGVTISPNNNKLLITESDTQSLFQIYQLDINGENFKQLTEIENMSISSPLWAGDSSCFYAFLHQNNTILEKSSAIFNANGDLISYIDFTGTIKGWIK